MDRGFIVRDAAGAPIRAVGAMTDITVRKQVEEVLRQSERGFRTLAQEQEQQLIISDRRISFGELAASFAHEFNNPLGIALGFAQDLLTEVDPTHPHYEPLKIIEGETRRCKQIMQGLVEFARPPAAELQETDLEAVVRRSVMLVSPQLDKAKVTLTIEIQPDLPVVSADSQQLEQILLNLFFNWSFAKWKKELTGASSPARMGCRESVQKRRVPGCPPLSLIRPLWSRPWSSLGTCLRMRPNGATLRNI
jgi:signal transduction histidine kinase